jgi:hypothetical protein
VSRDHCIDGVDRQTQNDTQNAKQKSTYHAQQKTEYQKLDNRFDNSQYFPASPQ